MKAELVLMNKRVDMAPRSHRRTLVVLIYSALAALMAGLWLMDRWRTTGFYMIFATIFINRLFLGGYNLGGLIKPFTGKSPHQSDAPPPFLMLALRVYDPTPRDRESRNDEREIHQRDRAHFLAYQAVAVALIVMWFIDGLKLHPPRLLFSIPVNADLLLYGLLLAAVTVSMTLPQAILLWTEPDMEEEA